LYRAASLRFFDDFYKGEQITSIYFGGGTPSLLTPSFISGIITLICDRCRISDNPEITLEANPKTIDLPKANGFRSAGINRLSIGVQSLIDADLKILGRIHDAEEAINCVLEMSEIFDNLSIDMIYNRPGQKLESWIDELSTALSSFSIQHISLYELIIEDGTAIKKMIDDGVLPATNRGSDFIEATWKTAEDFGFHKYEISNFAKPGFEGRHNISYWRYEDYYGIGPGAHSRIGRHNGGKLAIEQVSDINDWINFVENALPPEIIELSEKDEFNERLIMGLRAEVGIDLDHNFLDHNKIQFLLENSYIMLREGRVVLTNDGFMRLNLIVEYLSSK
jgi:oxygen-independent coproporphyrinogen-3 oxidase